jgi:hypothetical protein
MIIKTINPIKINKKNISNPSMYLSADGDDYNADGYDYNADGEDFNADGDDYNADGDDNFNAGGDEYFNADGDEFFNFDATGKPQNKAETKQFQDWLDTNYPTWYNGGKLNGKSGYGNFGPATNTAWATYGSQFTASMPSEAEMIAQAKKGKIWDKAKGWVTSDKAKDVLKSLLAGEGLMGVANILLSGSTTPSAEPVVVDTTIVEEKKGLSKTAKIGIAIGAVVVLGVVIYLIARPKNNVNAPLSK